MHMDKITEAISHFVGYFAITLEQARQREAYDEFKALQAMQEETPDLPNHDVHIKIGFDLAGFVPTLPYAPVPPELYWYTSFTKVSFTLPEVPMPAQFWAMFPGFVPPASFPHGSGSILLPAIEPPGSIAVIVNQEARLFDNDYASVGGSGLTFVPTVGDAMAEMAVLMGAAAELSPFADELEMPGSSEEIVAFINSSADQLRSYPEQSHGDADVFVIKQTSIEGIYVNGVLVDEDAIPVLDDHLPKDLGKEDDEEETEEVEHPDYMSGTGAYDIDVSVELQAGGNFLINEAVLTNNWLQSPVCAVMGDHVELNAIVQISVSCDADNVTSAINGWSLVEDGPTENFNIALFKRIDPATDPNAPAPRTGDFPEHWVVTKVEGDLLIMNWVEQFAFMMDNDVAVLSSSGVKTTLITGDNQQYNGISLDEFGFHYDLIVIGGNVYDANLIFQLSILMDNDLIGAVNGFETTGEGTVSTGDNLLWNQASIMNYGAADRFEQMSEAYRQACESLKDGNGDLSGILGDAAFAGIGALRVLYISGDILNLQYVKQSTIIGDNDQVALAMNAMLAQPAADWILSTGSNALVNHASIADMDSTGKTYVAGGIYSDEILIQAELISAAPELGGQNPDVLVNEAVAFLGDDAAVDSDQMGTANSVLTPDALYADPMQSVLA